MFAFAVFAPVWLSQTARFLQNNSMKTNKDRHTLSAAQIFCRDLVLVSGNIRFVLIFARVL